MLLPLLLLLRLLACTNHAGSDSGYPCACACACACPILPLELLQHLCLLPGVLLQQLRQRGTLLWVVLLVEQGYFPHQLLARLAWHAHAHAHAHAHRACPCPCPCPEEGGGGGGGTHRGGGSAPDAAAVASE